MRYSAQADQPADALRESLEAVVRGLGLALIELHVFQTKARKGLPPGAPSAVQIRAIVYKPGSLGTDDCSRVHRAILPRLEQAFPESEFSVEVSTPGINRVVKDGAELAHYRGRGVRLWRTDISDWSAGLLEAADEQGITIRRKEGELRLDYALVAKASLDPSQEE
ncbi:MAG: ribosome assembly cofactor RimP [Treponema sp.]|jgi:ribosome maturation factor RimP|nr:ribosome assembly cofactor RimP [Treponema sp.]